MLTSRESQLSCGALHRHKRNPTSGALNCIHKILWIFFSLPYTHLITATMADNEEDLVDYDEEEEEQNVAAEEAADAEGKEVKK